MEFSEQTVLAVCHSVFIQRDYGVALRCLKDNTAARGMLCRRLPSATLSCITSLSVYFSFTCIQLSHSMVTECSITSNTIHACQCNALAQAQVTLFINNQTFLPLTLFFIIVEF